ncbi:ABC transporter substrate-binding protein [Mesorhizobium sp.]|uniref:substrate-binding periplasmic protein n=1 Tax=Mesorhizobium sp. TaxID=1871066 RepID=UPI000FE970B9|nr:ABC transporter substrate-binding protein [Mesorhizobium sp.]RWI88882.1 MAG: amino acid ABC transporter substrate-binding protein [Mesorhizobium sp.]
MKLIVSFLWAVALTAASGLFGLTPASADGDVVSRIVSNKVLRVGVAEYPPFVMKDTQTGELKGFEIDAANKLADEMGVKAEFHNMAWGTIIAGLQADQYDVIMSGMGRSIQRSMSVDFTDPSVSLVDVAMVRSDRDISDWADIAKGTGSVAAVLGGLPYLKADNDRSQLGTASLTPFKELALAGNAVISGQAQAWIEDVVSIGNFINAHPDIPLKTIPVPFLGREAGNGYAVRKGDMELLNVLNIFINGMQESGEYRKLAAKWKLPEQVLIPGRLEGK